ncbi:hypothetical protein ACOTTU_17055 [Roseobacter sp. EG26]|uniref:hypothetical protein n=1 Tax=Roseobacter sp. EG26 TaxID=3412477 RepID=UPI003CE49D62
MARVRKHCIECRRLVCHPCVTVERNRSTGRKNPSFERPIQIHDDAYYSSAIHSAELAKQIENINEIARQLRSNSVNLKSTDRPVVTGRTIVDLSWKRIDEYQRQGGTYHSEGSAFVHLNYAWIKNCLNPDKDGRVKLVDDLRSTHINDGEFSRPQKPTRRKLSCLDVFLRTPAVGLAKNDLK